MEIRIRDTRAVHEPLYDKIGIFYRIEEVRRHCPELRLGQILATVAMLGEDSTGRSLRELEDNEPIEAFERFAADLRNRRKGRAIAEQARSSSSA